MGGEVMDPIETWHDAPEFEAMKAKIKALEDKIFFLLEFLYLTKTELDMAGALARLRNERIEAAIKLVKGA
jgi:hypothetical protein